MIKILSNVNIALIQACLEIYLLISVVWTCQTFENNFGTKNKFAKYLKESCRDSPDEQFSLKYFLDISLVREISPKLSGGFDCYRNEWVKSLCPKKTKYFTLDFA